MPRSLSRYLVNVELSPVLTRSLFGQRPRFVAVRGRYVVKPRSGVLYSCCHEVAVWSKCNCDFARMSFGAVSHATRMTRADASSDDTVEYAAERDEVTCFVELLSAYS